MKNPYELLLRDSGMPEELAPCAEVPIEDLDEGDGQLLFEALQDAGVQAEDFVAAVTVDPTGLRSWVLATTGQFH